MQNIRKGEERDGRKEKDSVHVKASEKEKKRTNISRKRKTKKKEGTND